MISSRHEEYRYIKSGASFVLFPDLERSDLNFSNEMNWHDNLEIQFCTDGEGFVLLDGINYSFEKNDIITVNSNVMHYTYTDTYMCYSALILNSDFLYQMGINYISLSFSPTVRRPRIFELFNQLKQIYLSETTDFKTAKQNALLLEMLILLCEGFSSEKKSTPSKRQSFEMVKLTIEYIRQNFNKKISLDELARTAYIDKYSLSREFKKITGQTVVEYINRYRCQRAAECISNGCRVSEAAEMCGFNNLSFFTKTFKKYIGTLPSQLNNRIKK